MTSKLPSLKGLPVSFLQQPTSGRHCRTAQLSPIAQSKKCQKFPPETEEGVFVGFSLFLLLAGSTGSIKLSKMPRPPHQQEALSRPRHWATERERGSKWRAPGRRCHSVSAHYTLWGLRQAGVKEAGGAGKKVSVFVPAAGIMGPMESHRALCCSCPDCCCPGEKQCAPLPPPPHPALGW